jgi:predicted phage terminase large subunit-like protein
MKKLYKLILENDFYSFFKKTVLQLNPSINLTEQWYLEYLADLLNNIDQTTGKYLVINIPPRFFKSSLISVAWPIWLLAHDQSKKIINATYSQKLSNKFASDTRAIISCSWFKSIFPHFSLRSQDKYKIVTENNGFRLATSTGGTITGEGGDYLILDDPHHPRDVFSKRLREKTILWFRQIFSTRINDPKKGKIILIMQRLHDEDLTGYLLKNDYQLTHINLPIIFEERRIFSFAQKIVEKEKNDLLVDKRFSEDDLTRLQKEIGSFAFNAQYLGNPIILGGRIIKSSILQFADFNIHKDNFIVHSWDTAFSSSINSDYSAVTSWIIADNKLYLYEYQRNKLDFLDLKKWIKQYAKEQNVDLILIEGKASGEPLINELKHENLPAISIKPKLDKIARLCSAIKYFESGKVIINKKLSLDKDFMNELLSFPNSANDDIIDTISQFLNWHEEKNNSNLCIVF